MATPSRSHYSALERDTFQELLGKEPFAFSFFQAVRLLQRILPEGEGVGRFVAPADEAVRFTAHNITSFPPSEVHSIEFSEQAPVRMSVNFMGLTGPQAALPLCYTELMMERARAKDYASRDFFDIFNHRVISLFYQAWEKYRFTVAYERGQRDQISGKLLDLLGLGTARLQQRQDVPDTSLMYYSGLLAQRPRSAIGLEQVLSDYFEVPVEIDQFAGAWYRLERKDQTCVAGGASNTEMLGFGVVLGDEVWDQQTVARVRVGPLELQRYLEFLPNGAAYGPLRSMVRFYFNDEIDFQLQLVLARQETPPCQLGGEGQDAPQLGWVSWMKTRPLERDPRETILPL